MTADPIRPTIRTARLGDVPAMVTLLAHGALPSTAPVPSTAPIPPTDLGPYERALEEITATAGSWVLVAELEGVVVGMCQLIVFRHFQSGGGRCAEIESMHVHPDHRSEGIGGALLESAAERAAEAGCYRVQLTSNKARVDAHRFYERHGFVPSHQGYKRVLTEDAPR